MSTKTRSSKSPYADILVQSEALKLEAEATIAEGKVRDTRPNLTSRELRILGGIGPQVSSTAIRVISQWNRLDAALGIKPDRTVFFNAAQGNFADAFAVYDVLRISQQNGGPAVTGQIQGMADTKSAIALQSCQHRVMTPRSVIILSEIQPDTTRMNTTEAIEKVKYLKWLEERGWKLLLARATNLEMAQIKERTEYGRQWWISAEEALKFGLIDEIGTVMPNFANYTPDATLKAAEGDEWKVRLAKAEVRMLKAQAEIGDILNLHERVSAENAGKHYFFGEVNTASCTEAESSLLLFAQRHVGDVELIINSPGGSVTDGNGLIDVIEQTTRDCAYTTTIFGQCASMAGFVAVTGKRKLMAKNAAFLIHRVSTIFGMSSSHMEDNQKEMERLENVLFPFMCSRTNGKLTIEELRSRCKDHDWWLTADECLAKGLVDELV
jgi:ATP-dependent Clp protease protease subunit